jgi:Integrase core domain
LSRHDTAWKNAEILLLRHQLVVVQRQLGERARPKVSWADRALITLLPGLIPASRQHRLRLIVTPGTVLRWRRDILRRRWAVKSRPKGRPATRRNIKALVLRMAQDNEHPQRPDGPRRPRGSVQFLVRDRGPQFINSFDAVFRAANVKIITTAIQAPVMNAIQERRHRSIRAELLDRTLVWNLAHLRRVLAEYQSFYNGHRPHRALGQAALVA